jgi:hypothetical protein
MSQFPIDAEPASSRLRRWHRAPLIVTLGLIVALLAVATLVNIAPDNGRDDGVTQPPPPCAEPGPRDLVASGGAGSSFGFRMPQCFRPSDSAIALTETENGTATARTVMIPVEAAAAGESFNALVIVSASRFDSDMSSVDDDALEARLWRDVDYVGIAAVSPIRRQVDGARGWRFTLVKPTSESLIWIFVKRTARIQVICRWTDPTLRARVDAGCDQLIDTLTVG